MLGWAGLVVIVDSLEKLRGSATTWDRVLESAERIFAEGAPHLQLPIHVLYTIPPALVSRKRFADVDFMPMIKLHRRPEEGGGRCEEGNRLLNEVGDQYRKLITADAFPWLAQVAVGRYLTLETEAQRQTPMSC